MASAKLDSNTQPIWESSRRPLHPKCVWIESLSGASNGAHRHFIFDYNLTNSYRNRNDAPSISSHFHEFTFEKSQSFDGMDNKMNSMSIIGSSDRVFQNERAFISLSDRPEMDNLVLGYDEFETLESSQNGPFVEPIDIPRETSITPSMRRISNEIDSNKNLLAERVLQWLDLAGGRGHLSARRSDHIGKLLNTSKRRSVTAKESRKTNEPQEEVAGKPKVRRELVHQLSMTFNEGNVKDSVSPSRAIIPLNFGDFFPATYKCSRKFLSLRIPQRSPDSLEPLDLQSSLPLKSAKKSSHKNLSIRAKPKRLEYFEDQYRSIIQRQILENSCNTQVAKRQLHIFMPNLPKRCLIVNDSDKLSQLVSPKSIRSADSDSCLSCRLATT